jgi:hypothetical protein
VLYKGCVVYEVYMILCDSRGLRTFAANFSVSNTCLTQNYWVVFTATTKFVIIFNLSKL